MKRVGILTFHYADSYGAVLQAYALRKVINDIPDCSAELINYAPHNYYFAPYARTMEGKKALEEKREKIEAFLRRECGVCTPIIHSVTGNDYDFYCVGSDQVWNTDLRENVELEYFLPNLDEKAKRIAYAASIGMEISKINKEIFQKYLPKFDSISLREGGKYGEFIYQMCNKACEKVLDPTLLLEKKDYENLIPKEKKVNGPFIFLFWLHLDEELMKYVEIVNMLARKYNLTIVHNILGAPPCMFVNDEVCMQYEGIYDFLWYMKNADMVVTNSFHGTIFSVQFERPFYIHIANLRRSRLDNIVELLGIEDRVIKGCVSYDNLNKDVDFDLIKGRLVEERKKSFSFIRRALDEEREIDE